MPAVTRQTTYLKTEHLQENLGERTIRSGAITITTQAAKLVLQLLSTAILARILKPSDFGMVAMVMAIIALVALLEDAGLSKATIQRAKLTHEQVSNLFWVNILMGAVLLLLTFTLAPVMAWFYKEPRLLKITLVYAITFPLVSSGIQHRALLKRQMQFASIAVIEILSIVVGVATAILFALNGAEYWALIAMPLSSATVSTLLSWILCRWRPGLPNRGSGVRPLLMFGINLTAFNIINRISRVIDNILIGRLYGADILGIYAKAYRLLLFPLQQINRPLGSVAIPTLSILQNQPRRYRDYYRKGIEMISFLGKPLAVCLFVAADEVILFFLGDQWLEAIPVFRALGPASFLATTNVASGWIFISLGQTKRQLKWGAFASVFFTAGIVAGLPWGTLGVAYAVSVSRLILKVPGLWYCYARTPVNLSDFGLAIWRPAAASIMAGLLLFFIERAILGGVEQIFLRLTTLFAIYGVLYVIIYIFLPGGSRSLGYILQNVRKIRPGNKRDVSIR